MVSTPIPEDNDPRTIDSEAMSWVLTHYFGDLTSAQKHNFDVWFKASEEHRKAYMRAERLWEGIQEADTLKMEAIELPANDVIDDMTNTIHRLSVTNSQANNEETGSYSSHTSSSHSPREFEAEDWEEKSKLAFYIEYFKPLLFAVVISLLLVLVAHFTL